MGIASVSRTGMSKTYLAFTLGSLALAIFFYNKNAFIALVFFLIFIGCMYGAGKLG